MLMCLEFFAHIAALFVPLDGPVFVALPNASNDAIGDQAHERWNDQRY